MMPCHLVILVNGLFGTPSHWTYTKTQLQQGLRPFNVLVHASNVNTRFQTYQGIDICGDRFKEELELLTSTHPTLRTLTIVAHSMGGLVARYACGKLFDARSGLICGLTPLHFVGVASPHVSLTLSNSLAQMPLIQWLSWIKGCLQFIGPSIAALLFRRTGRQFLSLETAKQEDRLLMQLVQDSPTRGLFCYAALAAFQQRTCYACVKGDQWVTWPNGSLRLPHQLPVLPRSAVQSGQGVLFEEPPAVLVTDIESHSLPELPVDPPVYMLARLQVLSWRRVDVGFGGDPQLSGVPHNKVQGRNVTKGSKLVVQHLVDLLATHLRTSGPAVNDVTHIDATLVHECKPSL